MKCKCAEVELGSHDEYEINGVLHRLHFPCFYLEKSTHVTIKSDLSIEAIAEKHAVKLHGSSLVQVGSLPLILDAFKSAITEATELVKNDEQILNARLTETKLVFIAEGRTSTIRHDALETPNGAEALQHMLKCWLVLGCTEVSLKCEWRKTEIDAARK